MKTLIADEPVRYLVEIRSMDGSLCFHTAPDRDSCFDYAATRQRAGDKIKYYQRAEEIFDHVRWVPFP